MEPTSHEQFLRALQHLSAQRLDLDPARQLPRSRRCRTSGTPLLVGEWGGVCNDTVWNQDSLLGTAAWQSALLNFVIDRGFSGWFYWTLNDAAALPASTSTQEHKSVGRSKAPNRGRGEVVFASTLASLPVQTQQIELTTGTGTNSATSCASNTLGDGEAIVTD